MTGVGTASGVAAAASHRLPLDMGVDFEADQRAIEADFGLATDGELDAAIRPSSSR